MSFRSYLAIIEKEDVEKIANTTWKELHDKYNIEYPYDLIKNFKIIFEFGSYSDFDTDILKITNYLFKKKETRLLFSQYYFKKITENNLLKIIDMFRNEVAEYYKEIENNINRVMKNAELKKNKWRNKDMPPYNLNKNTDYIISDDSYEYNIFELVRLYKTIDFNKQQLLFLGY